MRRLRALGKRCGDEYRHATPAAGKPTADASNTKHFGVELTQLIG
jgi:hypothetical protein